MRRISAETSVKRAFCVMLTCLAAFASVCPGDDARPDPRYEREITYLRNKLGTDFAVRQVGLFVVADDLDAAKREAYEKLITQLQSALYAKLFQKRPGDVLKLVLFRDNASLRRSAKKLAVKSMVMPGGGFFMPYERTLCVDTAMGEWVTKHEVTHALMHADFGREKVTPWIDEGIAMLVESCVLADDDMTFRLDWRLRMTSSAARAKKLPALGDVLRMDFRTYNSPQNRMLCDAVSRSLLMYLDERGQLVTFYKAYRKGYARDKTGIRYLEEVLQKKIDAIETDVLQWVEEKSGRPAQSQPASGGG